MTVTTELAGDVRALLSEAVGGPQVLTAPGELITYARDATASLGVTPSAVVLPASTDEVQSVLRIAHQHRLPVVPRGAGTSLAGGTVALRHAIVLSMAWMRATLEVSPREMLVRAEAGTTTQSVIQAAADVGLLYPPDPGSRSVCTIGGNVATCAGGLRGLKYGVTRNYILGLTAVLADGSRITTGGRLWKDVAGYDLTRLLTGSEGTLAVITEVTVALRPAPRFEAVGLAFFDSLADAAATVDAIVGSGILPSTLEFLDGQCINAVEDFGGLGLDRSAGALLLFGDDGEPDAVRASMAAMAEHAAAGGGEGLRIAEDPAGLEELLHARRCSLPALSRLGAVTILEDVTVPRPAMAEMVRFIGEAAARHEVLIATFGHAGDGNLHPTACLPAGDAAALRRAHHAFDDIFTAAIALGASITREHGVGLAKLPYLASQLGATQMDLLRRVKQAFDPLGILNPGKLGS